jgi:hypothetical protein
MSAITLKIELNKGRRGIVVQKLAKIAEETEKFLESFAEDVNLSKTEWLADNFENKSVDFEVHYAGIAEPSVIEFGQKALAHIINPETTLETLSFGISQKTFLHFALMAHPLDLDDYIGIGTRNGDNRFHMEKLTKERALKIEQEANRPIEEYAGFQGVITALFKENNSCWLKDYLTGNRVVCEYPSNIYPTIWKLLERRDALVNVEGWYMVKGNESRLKIEDIRELPSYQEGDIDKFFGCDKDFTGNKTTEQFLDELRED